MGLKDIYKPELEPIYPATTDEYISSIPGTETYGIPRDLAERPGGLLSYVKQALEANREELRDLEVKRRAIAFRSSVLAELLYTYPELMDNLPVEVRSEAEEWASRIQNT